MSFIAPLFLAGAAAVALPLIFHLIRRSTREKIVFSSLMFLQPTPPRVTRRSRLENIFLLLLRCGVLCLLALAFARPFLQKPLAGEAAATRSARLAVLVDTSASMRRENLWDDARNRAIDVIRRAEPADAIALYTFDARLRPVLSFDEAAQLGASERAAGAEARLKAVEPGWSATRLGQSILQATEHLLEELNRDSKEQGNSVLRVVVISDFQNGASLEGLQGFEWPKQIEVQLETLSATERSNAGLQVMEDAQPLFSAATNVPLRLRLSNAAESRAEQFTLQWRTNGAPAGAPLKAYVPPGESRIVTVPVIPPGAEVLVLDGDRVAFDNSVYIARAQVQPVTVAFYGPDREADPAGLRYYLHRVFEQTNLSTRVLALSNAVPASARESGLLVLAGSPTPEVLDLARELLEAGRTVLLPLRSSAEANIISSLTGGLLVAAPEAEVANYGLIGQISFQHPLFAPFSDARFNDFTKIHFWKHRALNLANITNATILAALDSGAPLLSEIPVGKGRLLVLASTWAPVDSQLALSSKFVPLLFGMLEQSAGARADVHQFYVGDRVPLPAGFKGEVILPDGTSQEATNAFTGTLSPGVYRAGEYQFAVNLHPSESRIAPLGPEDLSLLGVPLNATLDAGEGARAEQRQRHRLASETEARQKLWRNFLLAAVGIVLLETFVSGRLSRRPIAA